MADTRALKEYVMMPMKLDLVENRNCLSAPPKINASFNCSFIFVQIWYSNVFDFQISSRNRTQSAISSDSYYSKTMIQNTESNEKTEGDVSAMLKTVACY